MTNLLPLETWRAIMGFHPFHFWQLADQDKLRITSSCPALVYEHAYQVADAVGRQEIREAIATAEARLREHLGYGVAPRHTSETVEWPGLGDTRLFRTGAWGADGRWLTVQLREGETRAMGVESLTVIGANRPVTQSDEDGDGINDTFTISAATSVTDTSQIAVYFSANERYDGTGASERWRVLPVTVSISGGTVTVKGRLWQIVDPIRYEGFNLQSLDPATGATFAATLDIYQRTTSGAGTTVATSQAVITWETDPASGFACCGTATDPYGGSAYDPAAVAQAVARAGIRDARRGVVFAAEATYNSTTGIWSSLDWSVCAGPDRVLLRYEAGLPLESDGQMSAAWRPIVARLAAAELARPVCGCEPANRELYRWQVDLARTGGNNDEQFGAISAVDLDNPLGTRRGHVYAWRRILQLRQLRGVAAG